jgi:predicted amidohydrolase YtcJ
VDLHGKFLMPGMIDAHAHPIFGGMTLVMANYPDTNDSIPDLIKFIDTQIDAKKSFIGDTLMIHDIDLGFWSHSAELDAVLSHGRYAAIPIVLNGMDGHTGWANKAARDRAGITADFIRALPADKQKFIGFDSGFVPNGFVVDSGKTIIDQSLPKPSPEMAYAAGLAGVQYMNSVGITGWLDAAAVGDASGAPLSKTDSGFLPVYRELAKRGMLTAHVAAYPVVSPDAGTAQIDTVLKLKKQYSDVPNLTIPGLKIFADGVVEYPSQTAAMVAPYVNTNKIVPPLFKQEAMNAMVAQADKRGLQVHVHAIGDAAAKGALDAFELARKANPDSKLKFVITHAQFVDKEDQQRFAEYNVIAALQLLWAVADPSTNEIVKPYIDPVAYQTMYPARSLLEKGTEIAGASDWPVSSALPFDAIYQSETRGGPQGVLFPDQRMPRLAMLYAYTRNAADVLNQLKTIGTLAPGKRADLVLVDRDVLTVSDDELKDTKILSTMFAGKQIYGDGL